MRGQENVQQHADVSNKIFNYADLLLLLPLVVAVEVAVAVVVPMH